MTQKPSTAAMIEHEHSTDDVYAAPKKKQEKMNLGEFLTNQCEYKATSGFGAHCTANHARELVNMMSDGR